MQPQDRYFERFWTKVDRSSDCWLWLAHKNPKGYGVYYSGKMGMAHRYSYEKLVGPIPHGLVLDHLCRTRHCVNPAHMEPVTDRENILRGEGLAAEAARAEACKRGHPFTEGSFYISKDGRSRNCKTCQSLRSAAYYRRSH